MTPSLPVEEPTNPNSLRDARFLGTETRLDGGGGGRDTDASQNVPMQTLASAISGANVVDIDVQGHSSFAEGASTTLPSLVLAFADSTVQADTTTSSGTETFQKGAGGGRDADIELLAAATSTKLGDPTARDTDVEQLDYAAIGQRNTH